MSFQTKESKMILFRPCKVQFPYHMVVRGPKDGLLKNNIRWGPDVKLPKLRNKYKVRTLGMSNKN